MRTVHRLPAPAVLGLLLLLCLPAGCATVEGEHEHIHGPSDDAASIDQATTCGATVARFPVAGPHNNGWDSSWSNFSCVGNTASRFNSDYIAGSHLGNDIFAERGTPVQAAVDGTVSGTFTDPTGGNVVYLVDDCGWTHYYAHLDTVTITGNRRVTAGTRLGTLGNTGNAAGTAPHLHYSIYPDGSYRRGIDPAPLTQPVQGTACGGGGDPDPDPDPAVCRDELPPLTPPGGDPVEVPERATGLSPDDWLDVGSAEVSMTWTAAARATDYDITVLYWNGAGWTDYYTWNSTEPSFTAWPVHHDTHYAWTVKANNSAGQAPQSEWAYFYLD